MKEERQSKTEGNEIFKGVLKSIKARKALITKDPAGYLVQQIKKYYNNEDSSFISDVELISSKVKKMSGGMFLKAVKLLDGSIRVYQVKQLNQYGHLTYYLKLKTAEKFNPISVALKVSAENRIEQNDIINMLISKSSEDPEFNKNYLSTSILGKHTLEQRKRFMEETRRKKTIITQPKELSLDLPPDFDNKLFINYLKILPSLDDRYVSEILKRYSFIASRKGEPKYRNLLNQATNILFTGDKDQHEKTQIKKIIRNHYLYERSLLNSNEKYPFKSTVLDLDMWYKKDKSRENAGDSHAKRIIRIYKKFHKLYEDLYFFGDTDFIQFLAWTRNQISKDTGLNLQF